MDQDEGGFALEAIFTADASGCQRAILQSLRARAALQAAEREEVSGGVARFVDIAKAGERERTATRQFHTQF